MNMSHVDCPETKFHALMQEQIRNEFTASQQYIAIAVYFDDEDLPQLAAYFYRQAVEERNHAMMLVRYLLDRGVKVEIPGTDGVRNEFATVREALALALDQERAVTEQITALAGAARDERRLPRRAVHAVVPQGAGRGSRHDDHAAAHRRSRRGTNLFHIEDFVAREMTQRAADAGTPAVAGGP